MGKEFAFSETVAGCRLQDSVRLFLRFRVDYGRVSTTIVDTSAGFVTDVGASVIRALASAAD
ncbi:hypothetical protein ACFQ5X_41130 [Streptomyces kaempferi]|uniref:Uncharacterized protein n=1 Tax=Streptomyces kaempferi TaxID=333725 RepID=A0ABW3XUG3_9ACTN